jgi:putative spermidine/putrescine transport system permease protein
MDPRIHPRDQLTPHSGSDASQATLGSEPLTRARQRIRPLGLGHVGARALLLSPALLIYASFVGACLLILRYSFSPWSTVSGVQSGWTLQFYIDFFSDEFYYRVLFSTLQVSATATAICVLLGFPVAYLLAVARHKRMLLFLIVLPLLVDALVRVYAWIVLLSRSGLVNSLLLWMGLVDRPIQFIGTKTAVVLELLHELLPFMILPLASVLERIDPGLREAAVGLGASRIAVFLRVTLPLSIPGILAGTFLTFCLGVSAVAAPILLGGGRVPYMSMLIDQQINLVLNWPAGAAQSIIMLAIISALLVGYSRSLQRG